MWVYCPYTPEELGPDKNRPITEVVWGRESTPIQKGINEIPLEIAQAYFMASMPDSVENDEKMFKQAIKVCLRRWHRSEDHVAFLDGFIVTKTREELEKIVADADAQAKQKAEEIKQAQQAKK